MARRRGRPGATSERRLEPNRDRCWSCGGPLWVAYHNRRRLTFLDEVVQFTLVIRRCRTASCARYRRAYRPEEEGALALPWGLNVGDMLGHIPLPAKITVEVLPPIYLREQFGQDPDINEINRHVLAEMQGKLDELAAERRWPFIG